MSRFNGAVAAAGAALTSWYITPLQAYKRFSTQDDYQAYSSGEKLGNYYPKKSKNQKWLVLAAPFAMPFLILWGLTGGAISNAIRVYKKTQSHEMFSHAMGVLKDEWSPTKKMDTEHFAAFNADTAIDVETSPYALGAFSASFFAWMSLGAAMLAKSFAYIPGASENIAGQAISVFTYPLEVGMLLINDGLAAIPGLGALSVNSFSVMPSVSSAGAFLSEFGISMAVALSTAVVLTAAACALVGVAKTAQSVVTRKADYVDMPDAYNDLVGGTVTQDAGFLATVRKKIGLFFSAPPAAEWREDLMGKHTGEGAMARYSADADGNGKTKGGPRPGGGGDSSDGDIAW